MTDVYDTYYWTREDVPLDFTITNDYITDYTGTDTDLVIPASYSIASDGTIIKGDDYKITSISSSFSSTNNMITSLTLPEGITNIVAHTFNGCPNLEWVVIPKSLTYIQYWVFPNCPKLNKVYYNGTLDDWLNMEFGDGGGNPLNNGADLYIGNELVTEVNIDGITKINDYAFTGCTSLEKVTISSSVTEIGECSFLNCTNLKDINLSDSITRIGYSAFNDCSSLVDISIPNSVSYIGKYAFSDCTSLNYNEKNNLHYLGNDANPYLFLVGVNNIDNKGQTQYSIDSNCKIIDSEAFDNCYNMTSITIPKSVILIIGGGQFLAYCNNLTSITVASGNSVYHSSGNSIIETATKKLIAGCKNTIIPSDGSVTTIGEDSFHYCVELSYIEIPDSITTIEESAFWRCRSLDTIVIGESVVSIGDSAFGDCKSTNVTIKSNYVYTNAGTGRSQCGYLLENATTVRVLTSCIGTSRNSYLESTANFTKTIDGEYTVYTKKA